MDKNGFTLTELLAVIVIIGIISLIAIPNIVNISDGIKSNNMLNDAKRFISLAKLEVNSDYEKKDFSSEEKNSNDEKICNSTTLSCSFKIMDLNKNGDFKTDFFDDTRKIIDVDGTGYDNGSYVKYYKSGNELKYCIHLASEKRILSIGGTEDCINEEMLTSREIVHVK